MTAPVPLIHTCRYVLWTADRGWVSVSNCHMGQTVPMDPPTPNREKNVA